MAGGGDIEEGKVDESASVLVEHGPRTIEEWESTLFRDDSPMPKKCCIFRVPEVLRRQHKEAYEPDVVSIGPFHRGGKEQFKLVENVKKWYLSCVLKRLEKPLASLIESVIQELEKPARECYEDTFVHLDQNNFVEMLILDGCFLIELLRKTPVYKRQDEDDPIFNLTCMLEYLYHDLLLLENQLPWFVLEFFYGLIESDYPKRALSEVVIDFFKQSVADPTIFSYPKAMSSVSINHILDLIRTSLVQGHQKPTPDLASSNTNTNKDKDHGHLPQRIPSAFSLSEAGVTFKNGSKKEDESVCILDIHFEKGVFTIPPLAIDERTGPMFRNLMAFEQCYCACKHLITSYAVLMDNLIDTDKDVNLLCEKGIIANWLSAEDASKFFNELYNDTTVIGFEYKELCNKVHDYHNNTWNRWREKLKRDYFDTPWSTISFFAAFVLLVLTFLQTIYTIRPA